MRCPLDSHAIDTTSPTFLELFFLSSLAESSNSYYLSALPLSIEYNAILFSCPTNTYFPMGCNVKQVILFALSISYVF
jgi:hypothetical protein